ncbi:MAG: DUF6134 family protein [Pseudomonadota bacterium]
MTRLLAGLVLAVAIAATANADINVGEPATIARWNFDVLLNERKIGTHRFELIDGGNVRHLRTDASFDVKVLFFNAYRYRHNSVEKWENGCLASIQSETDRNGDELSIRGESDAESFLIDGKTGERAIDRSCVMSFAYWNPEILDQDALLNSQTGDFQDIDVRFAGEEEIEAGGQTFAADRFEIDTGQGVIKVWYQQDNDRWLALEAPAKGKRTIRYQLTSVPTLADSRTDWPTGGVRNDI